jgi:hypothetical protein
VYGIEYANLFERTVVIKYHSDMIDNTVFDDSGYIPIILFSFINRRLHYFKHTFTNSSSSISCQIRFCIVEKNNIIVSHIL